MISYKPLVETMLRKSMTVAGLAEKMGVSRNTVLREFNEKNELLRTDTLERVCKILECEVKDVIEWKEDKGIGIGLVSVNWEMMRKIIKDKGYSFRQLSLELGTGPTTISKASRISKGMNVFFLTKICQFLDTNIYEVIL